MFAHAVNTREGVAAALRDPHVNFLEADVVLGPGGVAVMGHDPGMAGAGGAPIFTFDAWLSEVVGAGVGLKVDIKEWGAVGGVLASLAAMRDGSLAAAAAAGGSARGAATLPYLRLRRGPAWFDRPALIINADVLTGTSDETRGPCTFNSRGVPLTRDQQVVEARAFLERVWGVLEDAVVSVGWTLAPGVGARGCYSSEVAADMAAVVGEFAEVGAAITFPVVAQYVRRSWPALAPLLRYPLTSLTVWAHARPAPADVAWMRATVEPARLMFDIGEHPLEAILRQRATILAMAAGFFSFAWALHR